MLPTTVRIIGPVLLGLAGLAQGCSTVSNTKITFFGWPDNSPSGAATAFNCGGRNFVAGGTGTFSDPVTFATAPGEYNQCEIIYVPYLKKYARMEDSCGDCTTDWNNGRQAHIDIWTGSNTSGGGQNQIDCENTLTGPGDFSHHIVRQPASNYAVDTGVLYSNGVCGTSHIYSSPPNPCSS